MKRVQRVKETEQLDIETIRSLVADNLCDGQPTLERIAQSLTLSPRTLQRRFAAHGINFSQLVDEVRFATACNMLRSQLRMCDIAEQLGYTNAGSFSRAFERWTGMSPQRYRSRFFNKK